ncbi:tyrosine-type recombinase/integrase [Sphingobium indicum]|uniref:tyrosine-type recombinase/integrase n=1 Tax=Sphingobium indicum TaxID=332055 RepID=UPI001F445F05|nr:tyrosine-type recombinase/integrase [Sphingobium indicum]
MSSSTGSAKPIRTPARPKPGGNPVKRQFATACERAGIGDFTGDDWRHHWASHCVMTGIDLITTMNMGGWKSLRMVQRHSSISVKHMHESINKLS